MFLLACTLCLSVCAMAQTAFYVYKTDGRRVKYAIADVDSILYTKVPTENGHEWVDLGLPSGLKWATCNVGANSPTAYGNYFAWGETAPQDNYYYYWDTYKFTTDGGSTFTKYNGTDGKTTLDSEDDAAAANWGGKWRMPTDDEWTELCKNCTWTWTADYQGTGIAGRIVTGPNGNSIFLPAAGCRDYDGLGGAGSYGRYWSGSLFAVNSDYAWGVGFNSGNVSRNYFNCRYYGRSVRPVLF